jgi:hypothetical protein
MNKNIIQGLWVGNRLTVMEKLSVSSFIKNGNDYHLYTYQNVENLPEGVIVKDGNEILPESMIFSYKSGEGRGSFSAFSNYFRYKLLLDRGGWWADTDMICIKKIDHDSEHVFATEPYAGIDYITSGMIKAPAGSEIMQNCWDVCQSKDPDKIVWGEVGPKLIREAVTAKMKDHSQYIVPHEMFCPVGFESWFNFINPNKNLQFGEDTYCVHMWNEMWRRSLTDKEKTYHKDCFYEQLKAKYL